ncbi:MAG TPA: glycosyltransferase family 39 protein, partial [Verrucomicrobiae bacterium]|nr:glycosyltransferase family 39 protein [Verrucomicrobiae bacterium]
MLQELIHKFEENPRMRRGLVIFACLLVGLLLLFCCNWRYFRNFSTQEAMDSAQLARNIDEGKGYTTLFVRPFSMFLIQSVNQGNMPVSPDTMPDYSRVKTMHPDVSNPPVYPVTLAVWMKIYHGGNKVFNAVRNVMPGFIKGHLPELNDLPNNPVFMQDGRMNWNPPDFFIGVFNEILFFSIIVLMFFWAKRLFDSRVAWMTAVLLFCSEFLWQFTLSGLPTMLLMFIFTLLIWCLTLFDRESREPKWSGRGLFLLSAALGLLTGLGGMTRYGFLLVIIPVIAFILLFGGPRRIVLMMIAVLVFAAVTTPWVVRNVKLTHTLFGTSSYAAFEGSGPAVFSGDHLERTLHPNLQIVVAALGHKLLSNLRDIFENDLPSLGSSWVSALFLAGLLIAFRNPAIRRIRYFLLMCLGILIFVQALDHTHLAEDSPVFNSENFLVLLFPLITVYGISLFFVFYDQMTLPIVQLRYLVLTLFGTITCLPFLIGMSTCITLLLPFVRFLPGRPSAINYPPYNPIAIQRFSSWMKPDEMIMSDVPWAVAWYGRRQSVWLTLDAQDDFFEINDFRKTVNALYLTPVTTDKKFVSGWVEAGERSWGVFIIQALI